MLDQSALRCYCSLLALSSLLSGSLLLGASDSEYGKVPLTFVANRGQAHESVRFTAQGAGISTYFTPREVVIGIGKTVIRMRYIGAAAAPDIEGLDLQEGKANYLIGNEPEKWKTDIPLFGGIAYKNLYPGIDMLYSSHSRRLKSEFVVAPGADPSRIRIAYTGAPIRIDETGGLVFSTPQGELREAAPEIYQEAAGQRQTVPGAFRISGDVVSFSVGDYDRSRELRIDPVLSYSTFLFGTGTNRGTAIAVDSANAAYVTGFTDSTDFPLTAGVVGPIESGNVDVFVTKLNAAGTAIVYSTYLGGSGDDRGFSIAVDSSGNAYITGYTGSTNFPVAAALHAANAGGRDAFIAKLNPTGSALVFSTYLGGAGTDSGNGIAIDGTAVYITGSTSSLNFPVTGAFQATLAGGLDGFVTKLNGAGSAIIYSTYLGGSLDDRGSSIAVDSAGAAYIAGNTSSVNFPTAAPLQAASGGAADAFVTKLSASGGSLVYSTYLGGSGAESVELGRSIAVDSAGSAYVTGMTGSLNFPIFQPLQAALGGSNDAFVVKLNAAGSAFVYSTFLGGSGVDYGESIAVDNSFSAYVAGYTISPDFPAVNADQPALGGNYDAFVAKLNPAGGALLESDFLGGSGSDGGTGLAIDSAGSAYLTGQTGSANFPLKNPIQNNLGVTLGAFVAKLTFGQAPPAVVSVSPSSGSGVSQVFSFAYSDPRGFADISWVEMDVTATNAYSNSCYLHYDRANNLLQLSNDAGTAWMSPAALGFAGTLQNSQCSVDAGASSASASGNNLTVTLVIAFKPAFAGSASILMRILDAQGTVVGWLTKGSWTVTTNFPPANVVMAPTSGSGSVQTFSFVYSDPYGYADLAHVDFMFQTTQNGQNACYVSYVLTSNTMNLFNDAGTAPVASAPLGTPGNETNSQCTIDLGASSLSGSGSNLTLTVAIAFKPGFAGAKNVYMMTANNSGLTSTWQAKGTWTAAFATPPANVSVLPSSGAGISQTFSFVYSDPYGYADISYVDILFQTAVIGPNSCFAVYVLSSNTIALYNDAANAAGSAVLGTPGTLNNSQCTLDAGSSSALTAGNNLTLNVALTFKAAFAGPKNIYMLAGNNGGLSSGWQAKGAWTTATTPPVNVSVSPASGSGTSQTFSFVYSDPFGYTDLSYVDILFQTSVTGPNACFAVYIPSTNTISLFNDAANNSVGSTVVGTAGTQTNSQCTLDVGASSKSTSGNNLTLNLAVTFKTAFAGTKNVYMLAGNNGGVSSGWQLNGAWTTGAIAAPVDVSVSPASGAGASQTFSFVYSDIYGSTDLSYVDILFQTSVIGPNACFAVYVPSSNTISLYNDAASGNAGSGGIGTAGTITNSQCAIDAGASSRSLVGNNLTLNLVLSFKAAFAGPKNVYMLAGNNGGVSSGWQAKGTWTTATTPPVNVSVTPASGAGSAQTFSFVFSDPFGYADLSYVDILFQASVTGPNSCFLIYVPSSNTIALVNDANSGSAGSGTIGTISTITNSQCTLDVGASSKSTSGNNLTLNLALAFKPAFAGAKNIYMLGGNNGGISSGWQPQGTWTAQ